MSKDAMRVWLNIIALIATLALNYLANALPLNGQTTGAISDRFEVFFKPAGFAFAIWGVIYLALLAFVVYQALSAQRENQRLRALSYFFAVSCLANCAWLIFWHFELFPLTMLAMVALLLALIKIYITIRRTTPPLPALERWLVALPFSLYLAWITVATMVNATILLDYFHWNGWGVSPETWAVALLVIAAALAAIINIRYGDAAFAFVLMWAFLGIAYEQAHATVVATAAWMLVAALAGLVVVKQIRKAETSLVVP